MSLPPRRFVLHIGTPKTGTTSLQIALGNQTEALARRGVLVPRAGRGATPHVGAHHALASSIAGVPSDAAECLPALLAELEASALPSAIVSSENFGWLYFYPDKLAHLVTQLRSIGFATTVVMYVRDQRAFAESAYAEFVRQGFAWSVESYVAALSERPPSTDKKRAWTFCFDYLAIADRFAVAFGTENVVVRPYRPGAPAILLRDFSIATGLTNDDSSLFAESEAQHNPRLMSLELLERLYANASSKPSDAPNVSTLIKDCGFEEAAFVARAFTMLTSVENDRIRTVFEASNRGLAERYACDVEPESRRAPDEPLPVRAILDRAAAAWNLERI